MKRKTLELVFLLGMLLFFGVYLVVGLSYPPRPRELPVLVSAVSIVLVLVEIVLTFRKNFKELTVNWVKVGYSFASLVFALLAIELLGMSLGAALFVFVLGWLLGSKKKLTLAFVAGSTGLFVYVVFNVLLKLTMPIGIITGF